MDFLGIGVGPAALGVTVALAVTFAVWTVLARPLRPGVAVGFALLAVVCVAGLAWFAGPIGSALVTWRMD
jgi:hypothetical protein